MTVRRKSIEMASFRLAGLGSALPLSTDVDIGSNHAGLGGEFSPSFFSCPFSWALQGAYGYFAGRERTNEECVDRFLRVNLHEQGTVQAPSTSKHRADQSIHHTRKPYPEECPTKTREKNQTIDLPQRNGGGDVKAVP
jgi:hypothetical protein